jgi:hypothetical protein
MNRIVQKAVFLVMVVALGLPLSPRLSAQDMAQPLAGPIDLDVDTTRAPQKILHAHLTIPVKAGPLTLSYPEWIPGEHQPSGPIINVAGLKITANGKIVPWRRDLLDMFSIHLDVPTGVSALDVDFDFLLRQTRQGTLQEHQPRRF